MPGAPPAAGGGFHGAGAGAGGGGCDPVPGVPPAASPEAVPSVPGQIGGGAFHALVGGGCARTCDGPGTIAGHSDPGQIGGGALAGFGGCAGQGATRAVASEATEWAVPQAGAAVPT